MFICKSKDRAFQQGKQKNLHGAVKMSKKDNTPENARPDAAPFSEEDALDRILKQSAELDVLRRRQTLFACLGVVLILAILILFLRNLADFAASFDSRGLAEKTMSAAVKDLSRDHELEGMKGDFREVFLPALKDEFKEQLKTGLPKMQDAVASERSLLSVHLRDTTRARILARLQKSFADAEGRLVAKHGSAASSSSDLEKALKQTENMLLAETEKQLKVRLDDAMDSLSTLNGSCLALKDLLEYKEFQALPQQDIESRMLESFLELWIYHVNPARGDLPAAQKGGI